MVSIKAAFISGGVLLTALILKLSLPVLVEFLNNELPLLWSFTVSWLSPPFLYLLLNCIILTLVLSSKLQPQKPEKPDSDGSAPLAPIKDQEFSGFAHQSPIKPVFDRIDNVQAVASPIVFGYVDDVKKSKVSKICTDEKSEEERVDGSENETEEFILSRSSWIPSPKQDLVERLVSDDKPLLSQRFSNRKSVKSSPEGGKARLGVTKPKRQDTLEATWRTITDGRPVPLTRHLKKAETLDPQQGGSPAKAAAVMKKAETFSERSSSSSSLSPSPGRTKREPTLSNDELNRRVEAFIRKFNEDMRLQRQESLSQYRQMVGGGRRGSS